MQLVLIGILQHKHYGFSNAFSLNYEPMAPTLKTTDPTPQHGPMEYCVYYVYGQHTPAGFAVKPRRLEKLLD